MLKRKLKGSDKYYKVKTLMPIFQNPWKNSVSVYRRVGSPHLIFLISIGSKVKAMETIDIIHKINLRT